MAIIAREKGTAIEPITEGVHTAVCIMVIDLGEQLNRGRNLELKNETIQIPAFFSMPKPSV